MPDCFENYGLESLREDEETFKNFITYLIHTGKEIKGYYGKSYFYKSMGDVEFWVRTDIDKDNKLIIDGVDAHCGGLIVWDLIKGDYEIVPDDELKLCRVMMFNGTKDKATLLPVHVITADVLPSFLKGDIIKAQVVAQPLEINYYPDEETFLATQKKDENGEVWTTAEGTLLATPFLSNHSPEKYEEGQYYESDSWVMFHAKVTKLYCGMFELGEKKDCTFIRCFAETDFGELEFDHTYEQVPEEQRKNIKVGSIINGVCILSGDAAIYKYDNGAIRDIEHDLRVLRHALEMGESERLRSVFSDNPTYESETSKKVLTGSDEIIDWLTHVYKVKKRKCFAHLATIVESNGADQSNGTRCLVLSYGEADAYESILFISVNDEGLITSIKICMDSRYSFSIDQVEKSPFEPIDYPDRLSEYIIARARFHKIIDDSFEELSDLESDNNKYLLDNAQIIADALQKVPQSEKETATENAFGYLLAKTMEQAITKKAEYNSTNQTIENLADEALKGNITTNCSPEEQAKLEKAFELGKQFNNDLSFFSKWVKLEESLSENLFLEAAVLVQQIGQAGAEKFVHG